MTDKDSGRDRNRYRKGVIITATVNDRRLPATAGILAG